MNEKYAFIRYKLLIFIIVTAVGLFIWIMPAEAKTLEIEGMDLHQLALLNQQIARSEESSFNLVDSGKFIDEFAHIHSSNPTNINIAWKWPNLDLRQLSQGRRTQRGAPAPSGTKPGGTRGLCYEISNVDNPFIALVPPVQKLDLEVNSPRGLESALGLTFQKSPILWLYIPHLPEGVDYAEVMLQDENDIDVLDHPITVPVKTGLFSFDTATTEVSLEFNKAYHWYFSIVCDLRRPSRNPSVNAWVRRISKDDGFLDEDFLSQLETSRENKKRVELYLNQGIWYEAITLIAKLRCKYPEDTQLLEEWVSLLQSIGIDEQTTEKIAQLPIVQCSQH